MQRILKTFTHVLNHTIKKKQEESSLLPLSLNKYTLISTKVNIETSDNVITGSLESKVILKPYIDSDPKAVLKNLYPIIVV